MTANLGIDGVKVAPQVPLPRGEPLTRVGTVSPESMPKVSVPAPHQLPDLPNAKVSREERQRNLQEALSRLNDEMRKNDRSLQFSLDKELNRTVIKVKNPHTGEVIRQIPDETVLRVAHNIESIKGLLVNELT